MFSFPGYGHRILNLSVISDQIHGNSLGIYPFPCLLYTPYLLNNTPVYMIWDNG